MKYFKYYYFVFIIIFFVCLSPVIASGQQSPIPVSAGKLIKDIDLSEVVFFLDQIDEDKKSTLMQFLRNYDESESPLVEYARISADKYYLNVKNYDSNFVINFSEKFHDRWKIYVVRPHGKKVSNINTNVAAMNMKMENIPTYRADPNKVKKFIQKDWVRFQSEGNKFKFISKAFYGSVQNDNLASGKAYETIGKVFLPEIYHLTSNSFSNAWLIDFNFIKKNYPGMVANVSKSNYEVGFIIEFAHKKLFIQSLVFSGLFILIVVIINLIKVRNDPISLWLKQER